MPLSSLQVGCICAYTLCGCHHEALHSSNTHALSSNTRCVHVIYTHPAFTPQHTVLGTKGVIPLLQRAIEHTLHETSNDILIATLCTLRACLPTADNRKMFVRSAGIALLLQTWGKKDDVGVWCAVCDVAAAAATACEPAKSDVMDQGLAQAMVQVCFFGTGLLWW